MIIALNVVMSAKPRQDNDPLVRLDLNSIDTHTGNPPIIKHLHIPVVFNNIIIIHTCVHTWTCIHIRLLYDVFNRGTLPLY